MVKKIEDLLLTASMLVLCCQIFSVSSSEKMQLICGIGSGFLHAGWFVLTGCMAAFFLRGELDRRALCMSALKYYVLFVCVGFGRFVLINDGQVWDDLVRVAGLISVPKYAEDYFTMALLLLLTVFLAPVMKKIQKKPWMMVLVSLAGFILVFFPVNGIRYPVFTFFLGGDAYRCLPFLVYIGYYFAGMLLADREISFNTVVPTAIVSCIYTVIMVVVNRRAIVKPLEYPVQFWVVLLPAGLMLLFWVVLTQEKICADVDKFYASFRCDGWEQRMYVRTAVMVLMIHVLRGVFEIKRCSIVKTGIIFLVLWMISAAIGCLYSAVRREGWKTFARKHNRLGYIVVYTLGFVGVFILVYLPFVQNGASLIWRRDAISQYFPKAIYYADYMREAISNLLQGNFSFRMYDFSLGLGDCVPVKLEPLYWLHALFTPDNMERGYEFVMVLRMYLSGLSVSALLLYFQKNWKITWICSYIYCFSGYVLYECTRHAQFMVPFILLPLLVIAVEEILRKKKWIFGCILIAVSLLCSYYFLYMNTIAMAVYFFVRYFNMPKEQQKWKSFWSYIVCFAGAYILGVGMGSMTIFTSLFNYFGSGRTGSGNISAESLLYYKKDWLHDVYMSLIAPGEGLGYWMKLGMVPLCLFAVVMLFMRKNKKELKACLICCIVGLCFPAFAYFMSGFGSVTNRWIYIFILLMVWAVAEALDMIPSLTKRELGILFMVIVPYLVMAFFYSRYNSVYFLKGLAMLLLTYVVILMSSDAVGILNHKKMQAVLTVVVILGLAINGDMLFGNNGAGLVEEYALKGEAVKEAQAADIKACTDIEDDSFYRVTEAETGLYNYCASSALGVNSVSYFNSTMNGLILKFDRIMGNGRSCMVYHSDFNNRTMLNALAAVKYYGALDDECAEDMLPYGYYEHLTKEIDGMPYAVYKTDDTLPLAYSYDRVMNEEELLEMPMEKRQELLMNNAVVNQKDRLSGCYAQAATATGGYEIQPRNIILDGVAWEGNEIIGDDNGKITFEIDPIPNAEIYFVFKGKTVSPVEGRDITRLGVKSANGVYEYLIREEQNIYYMDMEKHMINFGYSEEGVDCVTLQFYGRGNLIVDDWALYCQPMDNYEAELHDLTEDTLENISMENDSIRGTISADKDKLLVFSIPYQKGWTAWIDGEKAPLVKANIMYTGLEITPGVHEIELRYEMPGIKYGIAVTIVSVVFFVIFVCISIVVRKRRAVREGNIV